ncbi:MAG TPA: VWA domain-containing protein [Candidatus Elarobacter sp.]|nr:VWA domain-containing protein [Candidatus Elarobacter sp.]
MTGSFAGGIAAFTTALRERYGFGVGHAVTHDALRAAEFAGIEQPRRLRGALRAVYCASPEEAARFDEAFEAFFFGAHGVPQPKLAQRSTRPGESPDAARREPVREPTVAEAWQTLRARYSAAAARSAPPIVPADGTGAMAAIVDRLLSRTRLLRSRRRRPDARGDRIDVRRTLRRSVATAAEPIDLRRTAHAVRAARFVLLIDGSRSTAEHAGPVLQFASALAQRSRDARVFTFSTALRDVTRMLRDPHIAGRALDDLGEAWGGGTRIGACVHAFVRGEGARLLSPRTIVLLFSDGLDVGDHTRLANALRELRARSAAVVWLHPHASGRGFAPSAGGLRVARPYVAALLGAGDVADFERLPARIARVLAGSPARG